jgi:hypothetical protein
MESGGICEEEIDTGPHLSALQNFQYNPNKWIM